MCCNRLASFVWIVCVNCSWLSLVDNHIDFIISYRKWRVSEKGNFQQNAKYKKNKKLKIVGIILLSFFSFLFCIIYGSATCSSPNYAYGIQWTIINKAAVLRMQYFFFYRTRYFAAQHFCFVGWEKRRELWRRHCLVSPLRPALQKLGKYKLVFLFRPCIQLRWVYMFIMVP